MTTLRVAVVVGTRPEAIKLAPVYRALREAAALSPILISTGQHRDLLNTTLKDLELNPDVSLDVMTPGQTPNAVLARICERLDPVYQELKPAAVVVQGDTTTVLAAALAAFHLGLDVAHVEAGLRTHDLKNPFPEEANRQLVDRVSTWCFAPTAGARDNLLAEAIPESRVFVTGNTGIDSLLWALDRARAVDDQAAVLLTLHRRESFGAPLTQILDGVSNFLNETAEASVIWPVHPNPQVQAAAARFAGNPRFRMVAPMGYLSFVQVLRASRVIVTDSGGIQEEAPSLGKTVLVARETTERPEALQARNRLVGRDSLTICAALARAWSEPPYTGSMPAPNPYGDGTAGRQIASHLLRALTDGR